MRQVGRGRFQIVPCQIIRDYFASVLRRLANFLIYQVVELTPSAWGYPKQTAKTEHRPIVLPCTRANPSFSTRGVGDPGKGSRTTSWSKGLPHKSDVLVLSQKLSLELMRGGGWAGRVILSCSSSSL